MARTRRGFPLALVLTASLCAAVAALTLNGLHGQRAPRTSFALLGAEPLPMDSLLGAPLIVNFWATTCSICRHEMPKLAKLYRDLRPRGLQVIGVAMPYDPPNLVAGFVERNSLPYPVALDVDAVVVEAFGGITATPTTFLISPDGVILRRIEGRLDFVTLRGEILALLPPERRGHPEAAPVDVAGQLARLSRR